MLLFMFVEAWELVHSLLILRVILRYFGFASISDQKLAIVSNVTGDGVDGAAVVPQFTNRASTTDQESLLGFTIGRTWTIPFPSPGCGSHFPLAAATVVFLFISNSVLLGCLSKASFLTFISSN